MRQTIMGTPGETVTETITEAATPVEATPVAGTPVEATPVEATPVEATPVAALKTGAATPAEVTPTHRVLKDPARQKIPEVRAAQRQLRVTQNKVLM
jgi:hypothetical protein